jgi:DNA/RNA endonuclease YhcR with UshA esterase domain
MTMLLRRRPRPAAPPAPVPQLPDGAIAIADVVWRQRVKVAGRVHAMRIQPWAGVAALEITLVDGTGGITVAFLGRRSVPGIGCGTRLVVEGMAGDHRGRLAIVNPLYEIIID